MNGHIERLLIVSSRFPYSSQETYLRTEIGELLKYIPHIAVVPMRPPADITPQPVPDGVEVLAWPLVSLDLLRRALIAFAMHPLRCVAAIGETLASRDPGRVKNAAVIVKALALAQWAQAHRVDHIHAYWISTPATVALIAAKIAGISWSSTAHRWDIYERNAFDVKERSASFVRTISERGTADLGKRMPSLAGRLLQLRLGADVPPVRTGSRTDPSEFHIVCPAALVPVKGHGDLLDALVLLRRRGVPVRCTLAGTGPLRETLEARVAELGLSDVVDFTGFIAQQQLHDWYRADRFAAVVLASRAAGEKTMEGVPSALIEAMAFGIPVVATDSGSIGELIDNERGMLVAPADPHALADALFNVYADPASAQMRAHRAYDMVAAEYDVRTQMRAFAAVLSAKGA